MWQRVDVQIVRKVDPAAIGPFENADATDGILLNHAYVDMRGFSIAEAQEVVTEEAELLREIFAAALVGLCPPDAAAKSQSPTLSVTRQGST